MKMVRENPQLYRSIVLASGTIMHGFIRAQRFEPVDEKTYTKVTDNFVTEWIEYYNKAQNEEKKIDTMKVVGNTGLFKFFQFVKQEILKSSNSMYLRINAIHALRRMPQELNQEVRSVHII